MSNFSMNVAKGKEIFLFSMLSLFILWVSPASAFDPKDDRMEVNIQLNMSWTTGKGGKNIQERGSASIKIFGEVELEKKHRESLHYRATNLKATYSFTNTYYYVGGSCKNCCSEELPLTIERGSGSIEPKNFRLHVYLGRLGNRMAQEEGCLEPVNGVYHLSALVPISTSFEYVQKGCFPSPYPGSAEGKRKFDIYGSKPLDASGIYGSYKLTGGGGFFVGYGIDAKVWDYCGKTKQIIMDERSILAGNAQANLNWQIGKIKPIVKIWRHYNDRKPEDITDAKPMKVPVIVGEKIILEAEILPSGTEIKNGEWKIDDKKVIAGYEANSQKGQVLNLAKEDYKKKKIEFYWIDGGFSGIPENITYSADSQKGKVEGKTTITVFEPEVRVKEKTPSKEITVSPFENSHCRLYLGKLKVINPPEGKPGMLISHEIKMPTQFSNQPHLLWYVQMIKEEVLDYYTADYFQRVNKEWCLDTHYPYGKMIPVPNKVQMNDSPGDDLGLATKEVHIQDQFETYLMFIPSGSPEDKNCVWIPLKVVEWGWGAAVKRTVDWDENPPCDDKTFKFLYGYYTNPIENDCKKHPEWSCNVKKNKREKINEETWEKSKAAIRNIKSKQK